MSRRKDERTYAERREIHAGLQLSREIGIEKSGEFKEACPPSKAEKGNPERSPLLWGKRAETRAQARTPDNKSGGSARHPRPRDMERVKR